MQSRHYLSVLPSPRIPFHPSQSSSGSFFAPVITYATTPLPKLLTLDASHNQLPASAIDHADAGLPSQLSKIDLSGNPLGNSQLLIQALGRLNNLKELRFEKADNQRRFFPARSLCIVFVIDFIPEAPSIRSRTTKVTAEATRAALSANVEQELNFDFTTEALPAVF